MRRKKEKKISIMKLFFTLLVIVYATAFVIRLFDRNTALDAFVRGEITLRTSVKAIVIHDSYVIRSRVEGKVVYLFEDGQRVKKGSDLLYLFSPETEILYQKYKEFTEEISAIKRATVKSDPVTSNEITSIRKNRDMMFLGIYDRNFGISDTYELDSMLEKFNLEIIDRMYEKTEGNYDVVEIQRKLDEIYKEINDRKLVIKAPESGIFTSRTDGYEVSSSRDLLSSIDIPYIREAVKEPVGPRYDPGDPGKLIVTDEYFLACEIPAQTAQELSGLQYIRIIFEGPSEPFYAVNHQIKQIDEDTCISILRTDRYLEANINKRIIDLDIIVSEIKGIKIPLDSLMNHDTKSGKAEIFISRNGSIIRLSVDVEAYDERYAIIDSEDIKVYDLLVREPGKVREGMYIQ